MPLKRLRLKVRRLRQARKPSRSALAKQAGIPETYVAKLERGSSDTIDVRQHLAEALGVPVAAPLE
jgi:transcriptional regulator with XRE-family HTH domain